MQRKMVEISKKLSLLCLGVCAILFGVGLLQGKPLLSMLLIAVSLAVAAIPEGLPAIVTIVLALGVPAPGRPTRHREEAARRGDVGLRQRHLLATKPAPSPATK